jgi:hypothetical protein
MPEYGIQAKKVLWYQDDIWNLLALPFSLLFLFFSFSEPRQRGNGLRSEMGYSIAEKTFIGFFIR